MKALFTLLVGLVSLATETPIQQAESYYQNYEFKKALNTWVQLYNKSPDNWSYAKRVAELQLLIDGRSKAQETLNLYLSTRNRFLSSSQRQEILNTRIELSEVFLSEEAQTHYLQALSKTKLNEWTSSLAPISQAAQIEADNLKILTLKYEIEKHLGSHSPAFETLKAIQKIDSLSPRVIERLAESHIFHSRFADAKTLLDGTDKNLLSNRGKLARMVSLWELGQKEEAQDLLLEMTQYKRTELSHHPVILWMIYRSEAEESPDSSGAKSALKAFLKSSADLQHTLIDGWDPYRLSYHRPNLSK